MYKKSHCILRIHYPVVSSSHLSFACHQSIQKALTSLASTSFNRARSTSLSRPRSSDYTNYTRALFRAYIIAPAIFAPDDLSPPFSTPQRRQRRRRDVDPSMRYRHLRQTWASLYHQRSWTRLHNRISPYSSLPHSVVWWPCQCFEFTCESINGVPCQRRERVSWITVHAWMQFV